MATTVDTNEDYCTICERDAGDIPAEVRVFVIGVCVECWIDSVRDGVHAPDEIPVELRPLLPRTHLITEEG